MKIDNGIHFYLAEAELLLAGMRSLSSTSINLRPRSFLHPGRPPASGISADDTPMFLRRSFLHVPSH